MFSYFQKFFARTYLFYNRYEDSYFSGVYAILILSLLQSFNVFAIAIYFTTWIKGRNYTINFLYCLLVMFVILGLDYIWLYQIRGVEKIIQKYSTKESRRPFIHPWIYIIFTALLFASVRVFGFWPTGGVINDPYIRH